MLLKNPNMILSSSTYALRLPEEYLDMKETYDDFSKLLSSSGGALPFKLIIELPDKMVRQDSKYIKMYTKLFKDYNIDIGIFEFIGESDDYQYLQDLKPAYIKAESTYFLTQSTQSASALKLIADSLSISLIALGVTEMKTLEELQKKGIHTVQGILTEEIKI